MFAPSLRPQDLLKARDLENSIADTLLSPVTYPSVTNMGIEPCFTWVFMRNHEELGLKPQKMGIEAQPSKRWGFLSNPKDDPGSFLVLHAGHQ